MSFYIFRNILDEYTEDFGCLVFAKDELDRLYWYKAESESSEKPKENSWTKMLLNSIKWW